MTHNKPTSHDACFDATVEAIPGFATLPAETRHALFIFIRARTYTELTKNGGREVVDAVMTAADERFADRIDGELIDETCRKLIPCLIATMLMTNAQAAILDGQLRRRWDYERVGHEPPDAFKLKAIAERLRVTEEEAHRRYHELFPEARDA